MKSKFEYIVNRDENNKITDKYIQITITDKSLELAEKAFCNLEKYISKEGYNFAGCPWEYEEQGIYGDSITDIDNREEVEEIKKIYKEWKKLYNKK